MNTYFAHRNYEYGLYIYATYSLQLNAITVIGNTVGIYTTVYGPASLDHATSNKSVTLNASLIVSEAKVRCHVYTGSLCSVECTAQCQHCFLCSYCVLALFPIGGLGLTYA